MKHNCDHFALAISLFLTIFSNYVFAVVESPAYAPISSEPASSPAPQLNPSLAPSKAPSLAPRKALTPDQDSAQPSFEIPSDGIFDAISELPLSAENLPLSAENLPLSAENLQSASSLTDMLKDGSLANLVSSVKTQITIDPELKKICDATDHPPLCISMVSSNPIEKIDAQSVLELSIKVSSEYVKRAINATNKLIGEHDPGSPTASMLRDCRDNYHNTLDNFQNALDAISTLDIGAINRMLSAVVQDMSQCMDGFAGDYFPLSDSCREVVKMASNSLAIAALTK